MNLLKKIAISLLVPALTFAASGENETKNKMKVNLDCIKNAFETQYAPYNWKKEHFGWDIQTKINEAKEIIDKADKISTQDFQHIVKNIFNSVRDYHVSVKFYSTEKALLPFTVKGVKGRYFITSIDTDQLSPTLFPIYPGDELLTFNDQPIHEVILKLQQKEFGHQEEGTDRSITERLLTARSGAYGHQIETKPVTIQVQSLFSETPKSYQINWKHAPEMISHGQKMIVETENKKLNHHPFFHKQFLTPWNEVFGAESTKFGVEKKLSKENSHELGTKRGFIPDLGEIWWQTSEDSSFHAYLYETENHQRIGFIRIPSYMVCCGCVAEELAEILQFFEQKTDALVIDQVNNPGGSALYLYAVASMLTENCMSTPKHRIKLTYDLVLQALEVEKALELICVNDEWTKVLLGDDIDGYPVSYQYAQMYRKYCRFIIDEWNAGKRLSSPYHLEGVDKINPHPSVQYTKPILILINDLDFSGGDFFPAILQDNKRAMLLGTRTAGAGGFIVRDSFVNPFGIESFCLTGSIAERSNAKTIENLGVTPDIFYELTEEDYQFGYQNYAEKINSVIKSLIEK